jgi:hypothetical protein
MKHLKPYTLFERVSKETKLFEDLHDDVMSMIYGVNVIKECDSIIEDIKDILLELSDSGLFTMVGYTPMTLTYSDKTPKIVAEVQGELGLCESNEDDINSTFERIKDYVKSKGYPTGFGSWEREAPNSFAVIDNQSIGRKRYKVYQMLIQK